MAMANGHPKKPAVQIIPSGELNGEATMKATMGAHGIVLASIPRTTAVVPQEHRGVPTAAAVAGEQEKRRNFREVLFQSFSGGLGSLPHDPSQPVQLEVAAHITLDFDSEQVNYRKTARRLRV